MTMKMVFNECSLTPARTKNSRLAADWMRELIDVLKLARSMACGGSFVVLCTTELKSMEIMKGYSFGEWLNDADPGTKGAVTALLTRQSNHVFPAHDLKYEFKLYGRLRVLGLGTAHLEKCMAVSLPSHRRWIEHHEITLHGYELDENGELMSPAEFHVRHASTAAHMQRFALVWRQSDKHRPGGHGTLMPLTDETAQKLLNCSVQAEGAGQRYGYDNDTLYEFQDDCAGGYHGYPITIQDLREAGKHQAVLELLHKAGRMNESQYNALIK